MSEQSNIRPLTREEQLEWYVSFLEEQIKQYQAELLLAKEELLSIKIENNDKQFRNSL